MRRLSVPLCFALLGCAPPPHLGGDDEGAGSTGPAPATSNVTDNVDGSGDTGSDGSGDTGPSVVGDRVPEQLDRTVDVGPCGYPGPGPSGYGTEVGQRMDNNNNQLLSTCEGEPVEFADFMCAREDGKNNRAILVNIGAGWCLPCQEETLEFPELYDEFHPQGFELVQVLFQDWEALAPTSGFCCDWASGDWSGGIQGIALDFPIVVDQVFDWGSIYLQDPQSATPVNMLIDANGNIRWMLTGQKPPLEVLRAQIELILQEPYAPPS
jgi:thiol-disulfide isomerase/thioredoxin